MRRALLSVAALLVAHGALAQQVAIFELNDFVDPRLHGSELLPEDPDHKTSGERGFKGGDTVVISRLTQGAVNNYWWQDRHTNVTTAFSNLTTSYYREDRQISGSLQYMNLPDAANVPQWRGTLAYATYGGEPSKEDKTALDISRTLFFLTVESTRSFVNDVSFIEGNPFTTHHQVRSTDYEAGMQSDVSFTINGKEEFGTFILAGRFGSKRTQRISYVDQTAQFGTTVRLILGFALGVERTPSWTVGLRPIARLTVPIPLIRSDLHVVYAPSGTLRAGRHGANEFALFMSKVVSARFR